MPEAKQTRTYPTEWTVEYGGSVAVFSGNDAEDIAKQFARYGPGTAPLVGVGQSV